MRRIVAILALGVCTGAAAAPADWKSYLCTYGKYATTQLVRVNEKDVRVVLNERDASGVKMTATSITFDGPRGLPWFISKGTGSPVVALTAMDSYGPESGSCRIVDND